MACVENIDDAARCGDIDGKIETKAIGELSSIIGTIVGIGQGTKSAFDFLTQLVDSFGISGTSVIVGAIATIIVIGFFAINKDKICNAKEGTFECIEGVVVSVYPSFNDFTSKFLPFLSTHKRIDVLVKRKYWSVLEDFSAKVFCYDLSVRRVERSPIIRCYEFNEKVCAASNGALNGAIIGGIIGTLLNSIVNSGLVGCLNIILCLLGLIISFLVAAIGAITGAAIGSHSAIGSANDSNDPVNTLNREIVIGHLIRIEGNMIRREEDEGANVIWWIRSPIKAPAIIAPNSEAPKFSYCTLDEIFPDDLIEGDC